MFGCLLALYVFFRLFGYAVTLVSKMARVRAIRAVRDQADKAAVMAKQGMETKGVDMKVYMAVIAWHSAIMRKTCMTWRATS